MVVDAVVPVSFVTVCQFGFYLAADGVVEAKRAAYPCLNPDCAASHVWQQPADFISVGAWPASLDEDHCKYVMP
jgi:hypothetical protein